MVALGWSGTAAAEKKRVGVPRFDGPQENVVRRAVLSALANDGYDVVGVKDIDGSAHAAGVELDSNDSFKTVARDLAISAFVTGEVGKKKAKITIRNGADGSVIGEGAFAGANVGKMASDVQENFSRRLGSAVERGRAPAGSKKPAAAPAPAAQSEEVQAPANDNDSKPAAASSEAAASGEAPPAASDSSADATATKSAPAPTETTGEVGPRALDLQVGLVGFSRSLSYNQDYYRVLRQYNLTLGPALALNLVAYPAAFVTGELAAAFGAELNLEYAVGVASNVKGGSMLLGGTTVPADGGTVGTQAYDVNGGLRGRLTFGQNELALLAGGGEHAFKFKSTDTIDRGALDIPDVIYLYLRVGAEGHFQLSPGLTFTISAAYRDVLNQGGTKPLQIAYGAQALNDHGYFPFLKVAGIDATATIGYQVAPSIDLRIGVDMKRYFFTMNSSNGQFVAGQSTGDINYPAGSTDPSKATPVNQVAGGATDQYWGITIGAAYTFGGVAPGAAPPSQEETPAPRKKKKKKKKADDEDAGDAGAASSGGDSGGNAGGGDKSEGNDKGASSDE
ncbi:MAG TPA: hypothetical protein VHJ20_06940 [Polyangia bacterium]|nr:hypothetical protein [Polyangia bacterium]